jgi:hypothetical protein
MTRPPCVRWLTPRQILMCTTIHPRPAGSGLDDSIVPLTVVVHKQTFLTGIQKVQAALRRSIIAVRSTNDALSVSTAAMISANIRNVRPYPGWRHLPGASPLDSTCSRRGISPDDSRTSARFGCGGAGLLTRSRSATPLGLMPHECGCGFLRLCQGMPLDEVRVAVAVDDAAGAVLKLVE